MTCPRFGAVLSAVLVVCSLGAGYGSSATGDRWVVTDVAKLASLAYPEYRYVSYTGATADDRVFWLADGSRSRNLFEWQNGTISDLGPVPFAFGVVNGRGAVAGSDFAGSAGPVKQMITHTYLWQHGTLTKLGTFGGFAAVAGLNNRGQVAETYTPRAGSSTRAAIWQNGKTTDLGTLGGKFAWANALNNRGQVVGNSPPASGFDHAFLWDRGRMSDLHAPGDVSEAVAVNARGQVVGWWGKTNPGGFRSAFLWQKGKAVDLGPVSMDGNLPIAINDRGWVIRSTGAGGIGPARGLLWHDGRTVDLGVLGGDQTYALAINGLGQIAGTTSLPGSTYQKPKLRAFLWKNGKMTALPGAVSYYDPTMTIDASGTHVVAGTCCNPDLLLLWTRRPA